MTAPRIITSGAAQLQQVWLVYIYSTRRHYITLLDG